MIIVRLKGGMGNQMFQYALGRRLSIDWNQPLKLDIDSFENQSKAETPRYYDLDHFKVVEDFAKKEDLQKVAAAKLWQAVSAKILRRQHIGFEPEVLNQKIITPNKNIYLDGFWHNEKYFESIRPTLLKEFSLKKLLSPLSQAVADDIKNSSIATVALHIRRGDYATDPATRAYHGLIGVDFYLEALEYLRKRIKLMKVFIFSDDIEWAKANLQLEDAHMFVSRSPDLPYFEEPHLMSLCQHNIIANSSFSWWGAWLNQNPEKIVVAPQNWLSHGDPYQEIPETWIKM